MNNQRRQKLKQIRNVLNVASQELDYLLDKEIECRESLPENLQGSGQWDDLDMCASYLEEASVKLDEVIHCIDSAVA